MYTPKFILGIYFLFKLASSEFQEFKSNSTDLDRFISKRKSKFIPWGVGLVRFENKICTGSDGFSGTCYTRWQCRSINGVFAGKCATVGTCCVVQQSCGDVGSYNNTYFVNPSFPNTYSSGGACSYTIQKCNPEICQVRIDFLSLTLSQPDANGVCNRDSLSITGGDISFTPICGENNGMHVYIPFAGDSDITITVATSSVLSFQRSWKFKISQIECASATRAPPGCLMYYTAPSGTVRSFNYGTTIADGTRQIANTNYGICVGRQVGRCGIRWSPSPNDRYAFTVSGDSSAATLMGNMGADCIGDYVVIPNPQNFTTDRFCGSLLTPITTTSSPYVLTVVSDATEPATDIMNRGFSLDYSQVACN